MPVTSYPPYRASSFISPKGVNILKAAILILKDLRRLHLEDINAYGISAINTTSSFLLSHSAQ